MARASDKASSYSPKHRIVGAIILVSLAVIFLPMILGPNPPPPPSNDVTRLNEIPEPETQVFRMPAASLNEARSPEPSEDVTAKTLNSTGSEEKAVAARPSTSVAKTDSRSSKDTDRQNVGGTSPTKISRPETQGGTSSDNMAASKKVEGWVVQVGTFSDSENAKRLQDRLQQSGFLVNLQNVDLKGRKVVRVRVGPYRQKHVAMDARSKIEKEVGLEGVVLAYP